MAASQTPPQANLSAEKSGDQHTVNSMDSEPTGPTKSSSVPAVRQLSEKERIDVCQAIGVYSDDEEKLSRIIDVKKLPDGLYKEVIVSRKKSQCTYNIVSFLYNFCLVLQLILGAILTSLGASEKTTEKSVPITVIAAANTVNAGIIALLHNSGLPGRFRNDAAEYSQVEQFIQQLLYTGVVPNNMSIADIKVDCWTRYEKARETVVGNKPANYIGTVPDDKLIQGK